MKLKVKHNLKSQKSRRLRLSEINELSLSIFIIKRGAEDELGAKILSITRGVGVSRRIVFESLRMGTDDVSVFFTTSRIEDVRGIMEKISAEFELTKPGNGKGFCVDIDGYLGAKALFVE